MTRPVAVLRPEPGNRATVERLRAAGMRAIALPLFDIAPVDWSPPDPGAFDALLLTSANAARHGGTGLATLHSLPVLAVGDATAAAARAAGFHVAVTGTSDLAQLLADLGKPGRLLWLCGRDRTAIDHPALTRIIPVYRADLRQIDAAQAASLMDGVALLHSARAGRHLAEELDRHAIPHGKVHIAAISARAADAAGSGWSRVTVAASPDDDALIRAARTLAIDP